MPRQRRCLLKGCEQFFKPDYHQARYCGTACQDAADRWRRSSADQTWRKTEGGRECRRQQSCRYRQRVREQREAEQVAAAEAAQVECEGQRQPTLRKNLLVPVRAATYCSLLRGVRLVNGSVRACAVRLYGASCSARRDGDGGVKGHRGVVAGFRPGARKYVVTYFRPLPCGPRIRQSLILISWITLMVIIFANWNRLN